MLYENTVATATLGLLRELMQMEVLKNFALVGTKPNTPAVRMRGAGFGEFIQV